MNSRFVYLFLFFSFLLGQNIWALSINDSELLVYKDYFQFETNNKTIRYKVIPEFKTSIGEDYAKEKARKAFQAAIAKTLKDGSLSGFKNNIQEAFIKEFIKTLLVVKLVNSKIQVDLTFIPVKDSPEDLSNELSSNQLIQISNTDQLSMKLENLNEFSLVDYLTSNSPIANEKLQYIGGVITLQISIADIDVENLISFDKLKANMVKGFVRFRKYYVTSPRVLPINIEQNNFKLNSIHLGDKESVFITTDIYKTFNIKQLKPTFDYFMIFPGHILKPESKQDWYYNVVSSLLPSQALLITGEFENPNSLVPGFERFSSSIKYIKYSLSDREFKFGTKSPEGVDLSTQILQQIVKTGNLNFLGLEDTMHLIGGNK